MENMSFFQRLIRRIREWFQKLLRILFPADVLGQISRTDENTGDTAPIGEGPPELSEEERRSMMETPVERRHIRFYGRVQGVGFRYHIMYDARNHGLTGWVKNLADGSVEVEIQGPSAMIDFVILNLGRGRWIRIDEMESEARQIGNESRMKPVNDFIRKFIQIFEIYDKKGVDEDAYRTVVDNYLSKLRDR